MPVIIDTCAHARIPVSFASLKLLVDTELRPLGIAQRQHTVAETLPRHVWLELPQAPAHVLRCLLGV